MSDGPKAGGQGTLVLAGLLLVALFGAGAAAALLWPSPAPPELPPARPIERPTSAVKGLRRLSIASVTTVGALDAEALRPALVEAAKRLDGCVPPGGGGLDVELALNAAGLVVGVQGDVGDPAKQDQAALFSVYGRLGGRTLPSPTDGQPARARVRLEPSE